MTRRLHLLLIDDDAQFAEDFALLGQEIFHITHAASAEEGLQRIKVEEPDAIILDLCLGAGMDGLQTLKIIHEKNPDIPVVMVTDHAGVETAVQAMKWGALHYTSKQPNMTALQTIIQRELQNITIKRLYFEQSNRRYGELIGDTAAMRRVYEQIERVAAAPSPVLIVGESGTGKELVAHEIHARSSRSGEPFVAVDNGAITPTLFESELFGHEKGAFTDAHNRHRGRFEMAGAGTLFLDEITNLPLDAQAKLLRVLEERTFYRVGGEEPMPMQARIIVASNLHLEEEVRAGRFRADLYYRLATVIIEIPPLRKRKNDIPLIAGHLLQKMKNQFNPGIQGFSKEALQVLCSYHWPGNVRELRNVVERCLIYCKGTVIRTHDVQLRPLTDEPCEAFAEYLQKPYAESKEAVLLQFKTAYLQALMARHHGSVSQAARESGIARASLHRMLDEIGWETSGPR